MSKTFPCSFQNTPTFCWSHVWPPQSDVLQPSPDQATDKAYECDVGDGHGQEPLDKKHGGQQCPYI